jgi:hypothetical protein
VAEITATRGTITDRYGEPLAVSTPVDSVWVNPKELALASDQLPRLAKELKRDKTELARRLTSNLDREFLYFARHMQPAEAQRIKALGIPGVYLMREYRRYYPAGEVAGHILGFTSVVVHSDDTREFPRLLRTIAKAVRSDLRVPNPLASVPAEATATDVARPTIGAFTLMDNPAGRWHEADLGQTVVYGVDPAGDPSLGPDASNAAMDAAFAAWSTVDGATIRLARGGAVDLAPLICDGVSQIIFGDPFDEMPKPQSCSGVLALGGYCTKGRGASESDVVNGTKFQLFDQASLKTSLRILSSSCNCGRRTGRMRILPETSARRADSVITAGGVIVGSSMYATTSFVLW